MYCAGIVQQTNTSTTTTYQSLSCCDSQQNSKDVGKMYEDFKMYSLSLLCHDPPPNLVVVLFGITSKGG